MGKLQRSVDDLTLWCRHLRSVAKDPSLSGVADLLRSPLPEPWRPPGGYLMPAGGIAGSSLEGTGLVQGDVQS